MTQRDTLRALDADLHAAFATAGFADTGTYTAPGGGAAVSVRAYLDDVRIDGAGDFGDAYGRRTEVMLLRADVSAPLQGGTLVLDGVTYKLGQPLEEDDSATRWVVHRG